MIGQEIKNKFLIELEKSGNIHYSCAKVNISRNTYYRWRSNDIQFRKQANKALCLGKENMCDIAEQALMLCIKDKKLEAIKYALSHNSPRYRANIKPSRVIIEHISGKKEETPPITIEDIIDRIVNKFPEKSSELKDNSRE